jgi:uncharacterized membrane protein (DUF373 family)
MDRALALVEKAILYVLMGLMAFVLIIATFDLIWTIGVAVSTPPILVVTLEALLDIFGMFLLVLVGLELLDTIKAYVKEHVVHAEIVLLAALIAVARKAITLDPKQLAPGVILGLAALLLALAAGYFLLKRAGVTSKPTSDG